MEVAYYTVKHSLRRRNNVIDLAEYRAKLAGECAYEIPVVTDLPEEEDGLLDRVVEFLDMVASAALTVSAFVATCVAIFMIV